MTGLLSASILERLTRLDLAAERSAAGGRLGERTAGRAGLGTIFREHRTYTPGDDLRYVDWNAWNRLRSLQVKVYELEENLDVHLIVDRSGSMGSGERSKLHVGCKLAAMVGTVALARGDTVRVTFLPVAEDGATQAASVFRGRSQVQRLVRTLSAARSGVNAPLGRALRGTFPRLKRRGYALLVTDFLDVEDAGDEGWQRAVDYLRYLRVELTCLHLVSPFERDPLVEGPVTLGDIESGATIELDLDDRTLALYRRRFDLWLRSVSGYLRTKEARHLVVDSGSPGETELLHKLLSVGVLR